MNERETRLHLPHIGMRIFKSSVAVFLCYMVYLLRDRQGIVFYSQLAVLWCIQPYVDTSLKKALQRTVGTFVGAGFGLLVMVINYYVLQGLVLRYGLPFELLQYLLISLAIIPIIKTTLVLHKKDASYFSCVVFLSIVVVHIGDVKPFLFVWNRVLDTMIGIAIGIVVNSAHLPRQKRRDILFISGLDDTLLSTTETMSSYSRIELNQMLADGLNFTVSTTRTPASLMEPLKDVNLKLPVIAMDGAVLYDIEKKEYLRSYQISYDMTTDVLEVIKSQGLQCFINVIMEDTLVIYHQELKNEAETNIYQHLYSSPYRNYLYAKLPQGQSCVYLMLIDQTKQINALADSLEKLGYGEHLRLVHYESVEYPGYSYMKIYNRNAMKENMIEYLKESLNCTEMVTFGTIEGRYDYVIHDVGKPDQVVRQVKKLFMPLGLPWKKN